MFCLAKNEKVKAKFFALILSLLVCTAAYSENQDKLAFKSLLQVNYSTDVPPILVTDEDLHHYLHLDLTTVFPGTGLVGYFTLLNQTDDTLKLAPHGRSMLEFLHLEYTYRNNAHNPETVEVHYREVLTYVAEGRLSPRWGEGNIIPPHCIVKFDASCSWETLSNLTPGIIDLQWVYDNSNIAKQDTNITLAEYKSRPKWLNIILTPTTKIDSIYFLMQLAERQNARENFQESLGMCQLILQMDSTNYNAMRTAADVLWKTNRFDEAIPYAQKGIDLIQAAIKVREAKGGVAWYHDTGEYIEKMQFFIDKCQRREKWKWAK